MDRVYRIHGLVQGVGFRPYVADTAKSLGLSGYVKNSGGIVSIRLIGNDEAVEGFIHRLLKLDGNNPTLPGAKVTGVESVSDKDTGEMIPEEFYISESDSGSEKIRILPPDMATCPACERELFDKHNRRFMHPFISCVSCGPRFSIIREIPYDRENTTMERFRMCADCADEYEREGDRRKYAQTICCNECGPRLLARRRLTDKRGNVVEELLQGKDAFEKTVEIINGGGITAIKDIGGYHLAHLASSEIAAKRLRMWKDREEKPFAVMFKNIDEVKRVAFLSDTEEKLLCGVERPIVLLKPKDEAYYHISRAVTGDSSRLGVMLPCNPIQLMLLNETKPLVMTSANRGGEPIITDDASMLSMLDTGVPDIVLYHDRAITNGLDDSIFQVTEIDEDNEHIQIIRRARGFVPLPVMLNTSLKRDAFASGGDLKSVFALAKESAVYLSGHFGDLIDVRAEDERNASISRMEKILNVHPKDYISDKHPGYISSRYGLEHQGVDTEYYRIQHHQAHALSVMAEHGLSTALAVVLDGTGYGEDGNVWGGEILLCNGAKYYRLGHLKEVRLLGRDVAARECDLSALAYLIAAAESGLIEKEDIIYKDDDRYAYVNAAITRNINCKPSSSAGRLFDAVASVLDICHRNSYEGQAPTRLQSMAEKGMGICTPNITIKVDVTDGVYVLDTVTLIVDILKEKNKGKSVRSISLAFHKALANALARSCSSIINELCEGTAIETLPVVLSGGSFANSLLLSQMAYEFKELGLYYYINEKVPCGDGGLALGQVYALALESEEE